MPRTHPVRSLSDNTLSQLELPALKRIVFDMKDLHDNAGKKEVYLQPSQPALGALDSLVLLDNRAIGFQFTARESHNIMKKPLEEMRRALGIEKIEVYFVVPETIFDTCYSELQKYEGVNRNVLRRDIPRDVHQYVLKIDETAFAASP